MGKDSLRERIVTDMKMAMRNKDSLRLGVLRLLHAEFKNQEIQSQSSLKDVEAVPILRKQIKQYEESMEQYKKMDRPEQVKEQEKQIQIIESYLPPALSDSELKKEIDQAMDELQAPSAKGMGAVIKAVQAQTAGAANNRRLAELVRERFKNLL